MITAIFGILMILKHAIFGIEYNFDAEIRHFAVGNEKIYVSTDFQLYQIGFDLSEEKRIEISNHSFPNSLNLLLPFESNQTLIVCGTSDCGYCEVLNISDISQTIYRENISVGPFKHESSVAFLVEFNKATKETYMLTAKTKVTEEPEKYKNCTNDVGVFLRNTLHSQPGEIFSRNDASDGASITVAKNAVVKWVDGFQTSHYSYLFGNVKSSSNLRAVLLRMNNDVKKSHMIKSTKGATLRCCQDKHRAHLVSSALISSDSSLVWTGIFTAQEAQNPENTALAIYNISNISLGGIPAEFTCHPPCTKNEQTISEHAVVFKHNSMTAVAAEKKESWTVLYIGTANGQLMKLVLDGAYRTDCATVLYKSNDDMVVFPRMYFKPGNHEYIYIALQNRARRVAVTQCATKSNLRDCIASEDPFCGWCVKLNSCSIQNKCPDSSWLSIPNHFKQKELLSFQVAVDSEQVNLNLQLNINSTQRPSLTCTFETGSNILCNATADFPNCNCSFSSKQLFLDENAVRVKVCTGEQTLTETLTLRNCPNINIASNYSRCAACVSAGCQWFPSNQTCSWSAVFAPNIHKQNICEETLLESTYMPKILSLKPNEVSFLGKNNAKIEGENLELVERIRIQTFTNCSKEVPVLQRSNDTLTFHIPNGNKETVNVCLVTVGGRCHSNATITFRSLPTCNDLNPNVTWSSGQRKIFVLGTNLEFVDAVIIHPSSKAITLNKTYKPFWFHTHEQKEFRDAGPFNILFQVANSTPVVCAVNLSYHPDPEFISFDTSKVGNIVQVNIQKKEDKLKMTEDDLEVWGSQKGKKSFRCVIKEAKSSAIICTISVNESEVEIDSLKIVFGSFTSVLNRPQNMTYLFTLVALIILILVGALAGVFIYRKSQKQMSEQMNERLELLECDIRNEIRQGFVDLQTDKSDLVENVGAIPYLDYKHFAMKIFFPEGGPLASSIVKDIGQDAVKAVMDERCQAFSALIKNQMFLTCFVHTLEEQKNFGIKDKCTVASLLTVALQSDLPYLTQLMEVLLQSLMDQPNNAQPKLLLRRTESIVEKLLTNWMSICLYGFLRETVGQPLFLLVSALTQQISRGPVDAITGKALYTLNEDWLLWQAQDFSTLKLKVLFAVGTEGEVSEPLEVNALTCDTVEQVKEKILQAFQYKFGFLYTQQLQDIDIEYEQEGSYLPLEEVDSSSAVQGEVTMLNTLQHYQIPNEASIKVIMKKIHAPLSKQTSVKDDKNFTTKYFHLIDPDIDDDQCKHPERKKLKLKEVYLTKLLSTKVAVHSFVENLFQSIWGMPNNKAPLALKYFFDFLDTQAEKMKIMDPDVLHIWKTNSVPLRFWVNILKNPNFVFSDLEKTSHLDACLSVIAQAFMDSFSLTDQQLGKHAPTNKLLYAKDIPQYKQEVKTYYKLVRDQPSVSSQAFKDFLSEESKKHENEFSEPAALRELYKYMQRYFSEIIEKVKQKDPTCGLKDEMHRVKELYESINRSAWI
ncbi:plexin-C1-like [Trichomycterus rosablanca]|uniref:plexin-C1-like n=1 Tax=Trichomycterus rosablanca TaxID=2290929 RepID=UPI002F35D53D